MFANYREIKKRMEEIEEELQEIKEREKEWPEGNLICAKNNSYYKWYLQSRHHSVYLPKKEKRLACQLAQKKYDQLRRMDLQKERSACQGYLRRADGVGSQAERLMENEEYERLLERRFCTIRKELETWAEEEYEVYQGCPEKLILKGTQGKRLRSKSEVMIDHVLYRAGIPFRYEAKLLLEGMTVHPDFTIRHPQTGEYYYWEHFGMMDYPEYCDRACKKIKSYCSQGIYPSVQLILTYETKVHPLDMRSVEKIVREYFL